jgi:hypothetical protein
MDRLIMALLQYGAAPSSEPDYLGWLTIPVLIFCGIFLLLFVNWILHLGEDKDEGHRVSE